MSYSVTFEPESITDLDLISDFIILRILNKLRVGDYRVIYEFDRESRIIIIVRVGHRSEVYD
ncbi:MAG: toxin [Microcystis flos-aquae DF17]|nr:MAG: toxin [Microcystis flos-aquae DF17]